MEQARETLREQRCAAESTASAEVEWFFTSAKGTVPKRREATPAVRRSAAKIEDWLKEIATFHVGALSLRFTPREWPPSVVAEFGGWTSLVVRLECAAHPSNGHVDVRELETAALHRLEEMLAGRGDSDADLIRRWRYALRHVRDAIRAYVKVRGPGPSVLPRWEADR